MTIEIYQRLAQHLDRLPAGYPPTPDGLELRILQRLFTPEEAALAVHLTLIPERAVVIAQRAGLEQEATERMLKEMAEKGLCNDVQSREKPPRYMASQFAIGIWEYQVKRLTPELAADVGEYLKTALQPEIWAKAPQLRTIPIRESIEVKAETLPYEQAELLLRQYDTFAVAPCICREEKILVGEGCGKPLETCLLMGGAAKSYMRHLRGREITLEEALGILETADQAGLVLQPGNIREAANICCCCGDCCGVLRNLKQHPAPATIIASAYYAVVDEAAWRGARLAWSAARWRRSRWMGRRWWT